MSPHESLSDTQAAAFKWVAELKQETYIRILRFAVERRDHGFTCDELASAWQCSHNHVSPRCTELLKSGELVATSRTRPTRAGALARVLVAKQFAQPTQEHLLFPAPERRPHRDDG